MCYLGDLQTLHDRIRIDTAGGKGCVNGKIEAPVGADTFNPGEPELPTDPVIVLVGYLHILNLLVLGKRPEVAGKGPDGCIVFGGFPRGVIFVVLGGEGTRVNACKLPPGRPAPRDAGGRLAFGRGWLFLVVTPIDRHIIIVIFVIEVGTEGKNSDWELSGRHDSQLQRCCAF